MADSSSNDERRRGLDALLRHFSDVQPDALSIDERATIANAVLADPRSARLLPVDLSDASARHALSETVRAALLDEEWHVVIDYRNRLRIAIGQVVYPEHPIAALILYATWFEHTLNGIVIRQGLLRGLNAEQVEAMVKVSSMAAKLDWLPKVLGLPGFEGSHHQRVLQVSEVRNQYLHYKWKGYKPEESERQKQRLRGTVADLDATVEYFLAYYEAHLEQPYRNRALATFGISREDLDRIA